MGRPDAERQRQRRKHGRDVADDGNSQSLEIECCRQHDGEHHHDDRTGHRQAQRAYALQDREHGSRQKE